MSVYGEYLLFSALVISWKQLAKIGWGGSKSPCFITVIGIISRCMHVSNSKLTHRDRDVSNDHMQYWQMNGRIEPSFTQFRPLSTLYTVAPRYFTVTMPLVYLKVLMTLICPSLNLSQVSLIINYFAHPTNPTSMLKVSAWVCDTTLPGSKALTSRPIGQFVMPSQPPKSSSAGLSMHWKELFSFLIRRCQVVSSSNITLRENTYTIRIQLETCAGLARAGSASIAAQQTGVTPAEGDIYTKNCSRGDKQREKERIVFMVFFSFSNLASKS